MDTVKIWVSDHGQIPISPEWDDVRIARSGWPDRRFKRGRQMAAYFTALRP